MTTKPTPLMKQYFDIREQYSDSLLLFQVGDFYEIFFDDAKKASSFLAIALTKRGKHKGEDIPLCGVPIHAVNHYLVKLIKGGFKVALCQQTSKPQPGKVVDRAVTKVFTPGTLTDDQMLDSNSPSYLLAFYPGLQMFGMIFAEIMTAQMFATAVPAGSYRTIETELIRFFPDEILVPDVNGSKKFDSYFRQQGYTVSLVGEEENSTIPSSWIKNKFSEQVFSTFNKEESLSGSIHLLHSYLKKNQSRVLEQACSIKFYRPDDYLILDASTQKNLEVVKNLQDGGRKNTLLSVVDKAITPMGSRTIKKWLQRPLVDKQAILMRQEVVSAICDNVRLLQKCEELFQSISDLERIVGRLALGRAMLNDYLSLKNSLKLIPAIRALLEEHLLFQVTDAVRSKLSDFYALVELLDCAIEDDFSSNTRRVAPKIIKKGFDIELDRLRELVENSQKSLLAMEQVEIKKTGITSLKIRYNNIAGYYIEVTKANLNRVPDHYIQQQTLVNRNRYVTQELKDLERDIMRAQGEVDLVEARAFERVKKVVEDELARLRKLAQAIAYLDGLIGFARVSYENRYVAPEFSDRREILISNGRHPVVEAVQKERFVPNDTSLTDQESTCILTGPNMGGKSTYLRQVALLSILAQSGCLIPASSAKLPVLDRIFTRIGSGDNLAQGKSTFLVEMEEAAVICNQATERSLVILDEVGRGTSTFDGMALAQAIIEHIVEKIRSRCLFATHYHELTSLKNHLKGVENYHMVCTRSASGILFSYKAEKGVSPGSFGIEVAKIAQLPKGVIDRANEILIEHESGPKHNQKLRKAPAGRRLL